MLSNNSVSVSQLIASPLFLATVAVVSVFLTVVLVRPFAAQCRLTCARRPLIEADLAEHCVEPAGKPDRKGRTPRKGLESDAE